MDAFIVETVLCSNSVGGQCWSLLPKQKDRPKAVCWGRYKLGPPPSGRDETLDGGCGWRLELGRGMRANHHRLSQQYKRIPAKEVIWAFRRACMLDHLRHFLCAKANSIKH